MEDKDKQIGTYEQPEEVFEIEGLKLALQHFYHQLKPQSKPASVAGFGMFSQPVAGTNEIEHYMHFQMARGLNAFIRAQIKNNEFEFWYCKVGESKHRPPQPVVDAISEFVHANPKQANASLETFFHDMTGHEQDVELGVQASLAGQARLGSGLTAKEHEQAALDAVKAKAPVFKLTT